MTVYDTLCDYLKDDDDEGHDALDAISQQFTAMLVALEELVKRTPFIPASESSITLTINLAQMQRLRDTLDKATGV